MPKKIYITFRKKIFLISALIGTISILIFGLAGQVLAQDDDSCPDGYPCDLNTYETFLLNDDCGVDYFNPTDASAIKDVCEPIAEFDFVGAWYITAIALQTDHHLTVAKDPAMGVGFSTEDCFNWGLFEEINFDVANLVFTDHDPEPDHVVSLDPFCPGGPGSGPNCLDFKVCRLKQDSNLLDYLTNPLSLRAGDLIIGFENSVGAVDHDDIVLVARQESRASLMPTLVKSKIEYKQTDPGTGPGDELTCKISIEEELLPDAEAAIKVEKISGPPERDCGAKVKLLTEFKFGLGAVQKEVRNFPLKKWVGTHGSPGVFTYCFPNGYCVVFTF